VKLLVRCRDAFESSFDDVVYVDCLDLKRARSSLYCGASAYVFSVGGVKW
jgi:hypothetical protein